MSVDGEKLYSKLDNAMGMNDGGIPGLISEEEAIARQGASKFAARLILVLALFFALIGFWAATSEIDKIARGDGKVIPSGQNKVVQHLEGGIVKAIKVREGDVVKKGQILVVIDSTPSKARLQEKVQEFRALRARAARLRAEADGKKDIDFAKDLMSAAPAAVLREKKAFKSRKRQRDAELAILIQQVRQRARELEEVKSSVKRLGTMLPSILKELRETELGYRQGNAPLFDVIKIRRQYNEVKGQHRTEKLKVPRAAASLCEAEGKLKARRNALLAEVRKELADTENKIDSLRPLIESGTDEVKRTAIRSPVTGTVNRVSLTTVGGVVKPGEALVEIVPNGSSLIIEARIKPKDRAFLHPGQEATVKVSAYDFSIFGGLEGKVIEISADAIDDENKKGETYFRVRIRTNQNFLQRDGRRYPIIPGMTGTVDIRTGKKTVLDSVLAPVYRIVNESLRER